jgi:hypothetical protein
MLPGRIGELSVPWQGLPLAGMVGEAACSLAEWGSSLLPGRMEGGCLLPGRMGEHPAPWQDGGEHLLLGRDGGVSCLLLGRIEGSCLLPGRMGEEPAPWQDGGKLPAPWQNGGAACSLAGWRGAACSLAEWGSSLLPGRMEGSTCSLAGLVE